MRQRGTGRGGDDRLPWRPELVHPLRTDVARLSTMPDRGDQRSIRRRSIVRRRREHRERLVRRRSTRVQLATRRGTERNACRLEVAFEAHCHDRGVWGGRLQQGRGARRQRGWLVVVLVDRRLVTLRRRVTRGDARTDAGRPRQRRLTFFFECIKYRDI